MNYQKKGLTRLLGAIIDGQVGRLVLVHKDRLLCFGTELVFRDLPSQRNRGRHHRLGARTAHLRKNWRYVLEIITVFPARLYGNRSHKNRRLINGVRAAVKDAQC